MRKSIIMSSSDTSSRMPAVPSTQASGIDWAQFSKTDIWIRWTSGNGSERIVLCKQASTLTDTIQSGVDDIVGANADFTLAPSYGAAKIVYRGTNNNIEVVGLTKNTRYIFKVFEINTANNLISVNNSDSTNNPMSRLTLL